MRTDFAQLRRLPDLLFPRRCPFCGSLLGSDALQGTVCPACVPEEMRLQHIPARLPEGEHDFYAVREAAAAYYYEDIVRTAVLRCKRGGCFWYARELADRVAVLVFGALPAKQPGKMPQFSHKDSFYKEIEISLESRLGRRVTVTAGKNKGTLNLEFYDKDDLSALAQKLTRE